MKRWTLLYVLVLCFTASTFVSALAGEPTTKKKLIELGWDIPTTKYLAKHWKEMEADAPFSGVIYDLVGEDEDSKRYASQELFKREPWKKEWFQSCVDDLKSCDFKRFQDNFIRINFYPAKFDWNDDEAWKNVCEKGAVCAWVAKETNGSLCFDFESYGGEIFRFSVKSGRSFQEAKALARQRGAEMCKAIVDVYPDVKILCLWMNSINFAAGRMEDPDVTLRSSSYGLLPAFIDGLLDSLTPEATLIDGCEEGYYLNGELQYARAACDMLLATGPCATLVSPENRKKYRAQVQAGFGFYLDMYSNPEDSVFYRGPEEGETRFERLALNLRAAFNASDQYVWVYGEQNRWWKPDDAKSDDEWSSWEKALPGITALIEEMNDPRAAMQKAKASVLENKNGKNLVVNGDFSEADENGASNFWGTWQNEKHPTGVFHIENGVANLKGMTEGCFIHEIPVKPGEKYLVTAKMKRENCVANIRVRWQDQSKKWSNVSSDVFIELNETNPCDENGMREMLGTVVVPENVYFLILLLGAAGGDPKGYASYDDVGVYKL